MDGIQQPLNITEGGNNCMKNLYMLQGELRVLKEDKINYLNSISVLYKKLSTLERLILEKEQEIEKGGVS